MGEGGLNRIDRKTRNNIFDSLRIERVFYAGVIGDIDFLSRLYNLRELPSYDNRFPNADGDIWQHCVNNNDYEYDWVFSDPRFKLLDCSDKEFLDFLCETVHPIVRPDADEASTMVAHYNDQLTIVGWKLVESQRIAGRVVYIPERATGFHSKIKRASTAAETLSSNWMQTEIRRIQDSIQTDPALAIGTSKDLIESCCKAILAELNVPVGKTDDLPTLSKKMSKALGLVPEGISSEAKGADIIKRTLNNLASIAKGVAELRGLYGSGHGRDGKHIGLEPRHARLAAACAIAYVDFATETHMQKTREKMP